MVSISSPNPNIIVDLYREGKATPLKGFTVEFTQEEIDQLAKCKQEQQAYDNAIDLYAREHPAKIYGQVVVNGNVFATVFDNGFMSSAYNAGLKLSDSPDVGTDNLAKVRLKEIAQQMGGKIKYSNFDMNACGADTICADIPDSISRPPRDYLDLLFSFVEDRMHSRIAAASEKTAVEKAG